MTLLIVIGVLVYLVLRVLTIFEPITYTVDIPPTLTPHRMSSWAAQEPISFVLGSGQDNSFNVAFGMSDKHGSSEVVEDARYG